MGRTRVVNLDSEPYDVYIGRPGHGEDGYFGNPFKLRREADRERILSLYRNWFYQRLDEDPEFKRRIHKLRGKTLGCFCKPKACHGDVIAHYLNTREAVMSKKHKAYLKNRLFVREKYVKSKHLNAFTYKFKEKTYDEMFGEYVTVEKEYQSYERVTLKGKKWIAFNCGDYAKVKEVFGKDFEIVDRRVCPKAKYKIKFRAKLRAEQEQVIGYWLKKRGFGIIHAPVRWGKTYGSGYIICQLGTNVLVLMDKSHLAQQWLKDFRKMTNVRKLEKKVGHRIAGVFKKVGKGKYKSYQVTFATFQSIWSAEKRCKWITKNRERFGLIWVDECHHSPAYTYSKGITGFSAKHKGGVSGTVQRRDNKHLLMHDIIGSITAEGRTEQLACKVVKHMTDYYVNPKMGWAWMVGAICKHEEFNEDVAKKVAKQARKGRFVLVHTERKAHCVSLKDRILEFDPHLKIEVIHGDVSLSERDRIIKAMNDEEVNVIIGARVMQEGITFGRADVLHIGCSPMTQEELIKQVSGRVRTPWPPEGNKKPTPIIHDWRLKGHGGVYASGRVRDNYWAKMKWPVDVKYHQQGVTDDDDLVKNENKVPKLCGNCRHFFKCRRKKGVRVKSEICKKFSPHSMRPREKLKFILDHRGDVEIAGWWSKFLEHLEGRQDAFWSNRELAKLNDLFFTVAGSPSVTSWG